MQHPRVPTEDTHQLLRDKELRLDLLLKHLPAVLWTTDHELRLTSLAGEKLRHYQDKVEALLGQPIQQILPDPKDTEISMAAHRKALAGGTAHYEISYRRDIFSCHLEPLRNLSNTIVGTIGLAFEVTSTIKSQAVTEALIRLGPRLNSAQTTEEVAAVILEVAEELFGWDAAYVELLDPKDGAILPVVYMDTINGHKTVIPLADTPPTKTPLWATTSTEPKLILRDQETEDTIPFKPFGNVLRRSASLMFAPLRNEQKILGLLSIQSYSPHAYRKEDLRHLQALAEHCAGAFERILTQDQLRLSEQRYRSLATATSSVIWTTDPSGSFIEPQPSWESYSGQSWPEHQGFGWAVKVHPEDRDQLLGCWRESLRTLRPMLFETRVWHAPTQTYHYVTVRATCMLSPSGQVREWIGSITDTHEQKCLEDTIRQSELRYRTLVETANEGIWTIDTDNRTTFVNPMMARLLGYSIEEMMGRSLFDFMDAEGQRLTRRNLELRRRGQAGQHDFKFIRKDGGDLWVLLSSVPLLSNTGQYLGAMAMISDITQRRLAEQKIQTLNEELRTYSQELEQKVNARTNELQERIRQVEQLNLEMRNLLATLRKANAELAVARDEAQSADRIKSAFLATMSHELRTPLNSILGFSAILLQGLAGGLNPEQKKQLGMVQDSARHLLSLITDILDISKIEAGQMEIHDHSFSVAESIDRILASARLHAESKGLELIATIEGEAGIMKGDQRRLEQILINLVNNAVKFTDQGRVTISVSQTPLPSATSTMSEWRFEVSDTGIGIKPEDLKTLFIPFRQIDTGLSRKYEGTGLGLAISQRLAKLMNGRLEVRSQWATGSTFILILPAPSGSHST